MDKYLKQLGYIFLVLALLPFLLFYMKAEGDTQISEQDSGKIIELLQNDKPTIQSSFGLPDCRITQGEQEHHSKESGHILAIDIACEEWAEFNVYAPMAFSEYEVSYIWNDKRIGDYLVLKNGDTRYVYWHTDWLVVYKGLKVKSWERLGFTNLSWMSTNYHVHIEKWVGKENVSMIDGKVNEYSQKLCDQRNWAFCATWDTSKFYFTHYDLWDYKQNDSEPCKGASGADLCYLARNGVQTMALTSDMRNKLGVKFWDKVVLEWDEWCKWIYEVHDEMNKRFRTSCVKRPGTNYCIKGDLPWKVGGACTVKKIVY